MVRKSELLYACVHMEVVKALHVRKVVNTLQNFSLHVPISSQRTVNVYERVPGLQSFEFAVGKKKAKLFPGDLLREVHLIPTWHLLSVVPCGLFLKPFRKTGIDYPFAVIDINILENNKIMTTQLTLGLSSKLKFS
jgi:hypothetical protein